MSLSSSNSESFESDDKNQEVVPAKLDLMKHFDKIPEKVDGVEYVLCKHCKAESEKGGDNKIKRIKCKPENMRRHLNHCRFYLAENKQTLAKPKLPSLGGKRPRDTNSPKSEQEDKIDHSESERSEKRDDDKKEAIVVAPLVITSPGCKTITVKYSRRAESMDITPGMSAEQLIDGLKEVFGIPQETPCFLRRETEKKVLLGSNEIVLLINNGETLCLKNPK
ncbi:hypothetical protein EIN_274270 [Entamoeba invadens IP1]|uniref:Uncharacterized protein n=1 Tax=Entamoeba invadens IP1 TaxID=370355 RepID=A0A0A1U1F8_ENTIV|nr:hypothetical protein EIN_274270 [Entamoeba invadens IP1]ELP87860.1 hypothetical protein EIN_274270 [Entamoeba invadens IP1]|eukprot:XP_004254631.1 hypothetical protein EIN_274270 [Entamoeba invadens IP1]